MLVLFVGSKMNRVHTFALESGASAPGVRFYADPMTADYFLVTTTTDTDTEARLLVETLVGERLAACAHIRSAASVYWWQGEVQQASEYEVEFKTTKERVEALTVGILARHSYDTPQLIVTPILDGSPAYLSWITAETTPR